MESADIPENVPALQPGTIFRVNHRGGFGYVSDASGENSYLFVVGRALDAAEAEKLVVGAAVRFRVTADGRVEELLLS